MKNRNCIEWYLFFTNLHIIQIHYLLLFFKFFRYFRSTIFLVLLFAIISLTSNVQSKELKILQSGNDSRTHSPIANFLNTSDSTESTESIYQDISEKKNEAIVHARKNEILEVPLFQYLKTNALNETAIAENNNGTASETKYDLNAISSSENGEQNERLSVTRGALRIAARHALEATHNLYDRIEPNLFRRGRQNIFFLHLSIEITSRQ